MNPIKTKGQTALEYLLIVVVAIIVVVAVMVWMQGTTQSTTDNAQTGADQVLCESRPCASGCSTGPCEGLNAACGDDGQTCKVGIAT
jgi:hypothetical protein